MKKDRAGHVPVSGDVIRRSAKMLVGGMFLAVASFLFGLALFWAYWNDFIIPIGGLRYQVTEEGALFGFLTLLFAPVGFGVAAFPLLARQRIVIGSDRVQMIRGRAGRERVIDQIPYWNIADSASVTGEAGRYVGVDLFDLDDPDTFASWDFEKSKKTFGCHWRIWGSHELPPDVIHEMLDARVTDYLGRNDE